MEQAAKIVSWPKIEQETFRVCNRVLSNIAKTSARKNSAFQQAVKKPSVTAICVYMYTPHHRGFRKLIPVENITINKDNNLTAILVQWI